MEQVVTQQVVGAVAQILRKQEDEIAQEITFVQLGADELDLFELVLKFEDLFELEISDDDMARLTCVRDVVGYVLEKQVVAQP